MPKASTSSACHPAKSSGLQEVIPDLDLDRILFTPNFAPRDEYAWALDKGLLVTLDNLYPLQAWPEIFADKKIFVRMDPGQGRGHHEHVKTAGVHSKFGVPLFEVDELQSPGGKLRCRGCRNSCAQWQRRTGTGCTGAPSRHS